jgi:hypothetical protein
MAIATRGACAKQNIRTPPPMLTSTRGRLRDRVGYRAWSRGAHGLEMRHPTTFIPFLNDVQLYTTMPVKEALAEIA